MEHTVNSRSSSAVCRRKLLLLLLHTATHFAVDFACYFLLVTTYWNRLSEEVAIIYVLFAFALQLITGLLADLFPRLPLVLLGPVLILLAFVIPADARVVVMGIGNAFFHSFAGREILQAFTYKSNGLFNGAGAFGLALGTFLGIGECTLWLPVGLLFGLLLLQLAAAFKLSCAWPLPGPAAPERFTPADQGNGLWLGMIGLCFMGAIFTEFSLGRLRLPYLSGDLLAAVGFGALIWLGKAAGSFCYEKFYTPRRGAVLMLLLFGAGLLCYNTRLTWLLVVPLAAVNLLPLYGLKRLLPEHPGLAFGLNKLGLAAAFFLLLQQRAKLQYGLALGALLLISLIMSLALSRKEKIYD